MDSFRNIFLLTFFLLILGGLYAQKNDSISVQLACGSHPKKGMNLAASMKMVTPPNECTFLEEARKKFQVICHIAKDSVSDEYATSQDQIQEAFDSLNVIFKPIDMSFAICQIDSMQNTRYYDWKSDQDEPHAVIYNYLPNAINIYFCNSVITEDGPVGGYALFPGGEDVIVMRCNNGNISFKGLAHEMGHFFGLYHTFEIENGEELADGSNCSETGDLICDTEADPNGFLTIDCVYAAPEQDLEGNWYTPPIDNLMSYYGDNCRCEFTLQQYNRMVEMYLTLRNYLW